MYLITSKYILKTKVSAVAIFGSAYFSTLKRFC